MTQQKDTPLCEKVTLEKAFEGGWGCYRIPGIVVTAAGSLLAYYENRIDTNDWNTRNIGLRRSTDGGQTWSERRDMIEQPGDLTINNPVMIATKQGRIHFFREQNYNRMFHQVSDDDGLNWSKSRELTHVLEAIRSLYNWTVIGLGPGHGIETDTGRLILPVWLSNGGGRAHRPSVIMTLVSDDGGDIWSCGQRLPLMTERGDVLVNPSEFALAQCRDGRILANIRHESACHRRALAVSDRGTENWSSPWFADDLSDPICCAGMVRLPGHDAAVRDSLFFSNCATEGPQRINLTIYSSQNDGRSWHKAGLLEELSGYSDLAASADGQWLYCFYEQGRVQGKGGYLDRLVLARMNRAWLGLGKEESAG